MSAINILSQAQVENHVANFQKHYTEHPSGDIFQPSMDTTTALLELFELLKEEFGDYLDGDGDDVNITLVPNVLWREELFLFHDGAGSLLTLEELLGGFCKLGCNFIPRSGDIQSRANKFLLLTIKHALEQLQKHHQEQQQHALRPPLPGLGGVVSAEEIDAAWKEFTLFPAFSADVSCLPPLPSSASVSISTSTDSSSSSNPGTSSTAPPATMTSCTKRSPLPPVPPLYRSTSVGNRDTISLPHTYFRIAQVTWEAAMVLFRALLLSSGSSPFAAGAAINRAELTADLGTREVTQLMFRADESELSAVQFIERLSLLAEHFIQQDRLSAHWVNEYIQRKVKTAKIVLRREGSTAAVQNAAPAPVDTSLFGSSLTGKRSSPASDAAGRTSRRSSMDSNTDDPDSISMVNNDINNNVSSVCEPGTWCTYIDPHGISGCVRVENFVPNINKYNIAHQGLLFQVEPHMLTPIFNNNKSSSSSGGNPNSTTITTTTGNSTPAGNSPTYILRRQHPPQQQEEEKVVAPLLPPSAAHVGSEPIQPIGPPLTEEQQRVFLESTKKLMQFQQQQQRGNNNNNNSNNNTADDKVVTVPTTGADATKDPGGKEPVPDGDGYIPAGYNSSAFGFDILEDDDLAAACAPLVPRSALEMQIEQALLNELTEDYSHDKSLLMCRFDAIYVGEWYVRLLEQQFHFLAHDYGQTFVQLERDPVTNEICGSIEGDPVAMKAAGFDVSTATATATTTTSADTAGIEESSASAAAADDDVVDGVGGRVLGAVKYLGKGRDYCLGPGILGEDKMYLLPLNKGALEYGRCFFLTLGVAVGIHPYKLQCYFRMKAEEMLAPDSGYEFDPNTAVFTRPIVRSAVTPGSFIDMGILQYIWHPMFDKYRFIFLTFSNDGDHKKEFQFANVSVFHKDTPGPKEDLYFKLQLGHFIYFQQQFEGDVQFDTFMWHINNANRSMTTRIYHEIYNVGPLLYSGKPPVDAVTAPSTSDTEK